MRYSVEVVRRHLRRLVLEGYFPQGQALPHIRRLAEAFGVSLVTAQQAVHRLREEGLVESKRGSGVFVKSPMTWNSEGRQVVLLTSLATGFLDTKPYPGDALQELRARLQDGGYELVPLSLKEMGPVDVAAHLQSMKLAGAALLEVESPRLIEEIRDLGLPLISMDHDHYRAAVSSVSFDNLGGGFQAAKHLIAQGHRRIAFVRQVWRGLRIRARTGSHTPLDPVSDDRMRGYALALQDAGLAPIFREQRELPDKDSLRELFSRRDAPTAVIAGDDLALGFAAALGEMGLSVPDDVSVVGFGGTGASLPDGRRIASIRLDFRGLGRSAAELFFGALKGEPPRRVVLPIRLDAGDSVAKAPAAGDGVPSPAGR